MLWGYGVNKTLMQNHSAEDGLAITSQFKGYTIDGITGDLIIDENGYRLRDLRVGLAYRNFRKILIRVGNWG